MYEFKNALKSNRLILICLGLYAVTAEVLLGIMNCSNSDSDINYFSFSVNIIFKLIMPVIGICLAYVLTGMLDFDFVPQFLAPVFTVISILCNYSGIGYAINSNYKTYSLCSIAAILCLAFYYVNRCGDSLIHTLFYIILTTTLAIGTFDQIEVFTVLSVHIMLFVFNCKNYKSKAISTVNYIYVSLAAAVLIILFIYQITDYIAMRYYEGKTIFYIERMLLTAPALGESEFFHEIMEERSEYNPAKIFGFYGYIIGTAAMLIISAFVASVCIKAQKSKSRIKPVLIAVAVIIAVESIAALFINFGVITGISSSIPLLSEGYLGYFKTGFLVGLVIASAKNRFLQEDFEDGRYILFSPIL